MPYEDETQRGKEDSEPDCRGTCAEDGTSSHNDIRAGEGATLAVPQVQETAFQ